MSTADVVIIGGGSTGTSVAFQLARRRYGKVILVERETVGAGPTAKTIGIVRLHYSYEPLVRLASRSRDLFGQFEELTGAVADFTRCGFLLLAAEGEMPGLRANVDLQHRLGIHSAVVTPTDIAGLDPRMNIDGVAGGAWEPESGFADGYATASGFAAAARRAGAEIWETAGAQRIIVEGSVVRGVQTARGEISTSTVLVACGPWTPQLLRPLGVEVPIQSSRQQVVQLGLPASFGPLGIIIEDMALGFYVRPETGDTVLAGVLEEEAEQIVAADEYNRKPNFVRGTPVCMTSLRTGSRCWAQSRASEGCTSPQAFPATGSSSAPHSAKSWLHSSPGRPHPLMSRCFASRGSSTATSSGAVTPRGFSGNDYRPPSALSPRDD